MTEFRFTFDQYKELLEQLLQQSYSFKGFGDVINPQTVLLRHDVDWSPRKAVRLAEIEADLGIKSTYLFLLSSPFYNVMNAEAREQIAQIRDLGHDIGLHFSTHQYFTSEPTGQDGHAPPDRRLVATVNEEREILELLIDEPINVVSFHNPPEWLFGKSFDEYISTYEERFFDEIVYRADSNQRWRKEPPFGETIPPKVQLLTHPVLWDKRDAYSTDRLREERDYQFKRINQHLEQTDRTWNEQCGLE